MKIEFGSFSIGFVVGGIIVGIIVSLVNHFLFQKRTKKDREIQTFNDAADKFRSTVINSLKGIYPDIRIHIPTDEINSKIKDSIPKIVVASTEFKNCLSPTSKSTFDFAVKEYCEFARKIDWNSQIAFNMFKKSMSNSGYKSPKEIFIQHVDSFLSFANKNKKT